MMAKSVEEDGSKLHAAKGWFVEMLQYPCHFCYKLETLKVIGEGEVPWFGTPSAD